MMDGYNNKRLKKGTYGGSHYVNIKMPHEMKDRLIEICRECKDRNLAHTIERILREYLRGEK